MSSDIEIYRSALALIKKHGGKAPEFATIQAKIRLNRDDFDGHIEQLRIANTSRLIFDRSADDHAPA